MSYFGAKRSFFRIFTTVIFVNLEWPIIALSFKKILQVDSKNKVYKLLGPIWSKNVTFLVKNEFYQKIEYW